MALGARRLSARAWIVVAVVGMVALPFTGLVHKLDVATNFLAPGRISADSPDRGREWSATADLARHHLLSGVGPGNFNVSFAHDGRTYVAEFAHNEYLQTLAELGVVGAVLVAAGAVVLTRALARQRRRADPGTWSGSVAGLVALAVHSGFDFVGHVPVALLVGALLVGFALAAISLPDPEKGT